MKAKWKNNDMKTDSKIIIVLIIFCQNFYYFFKYETFITELGLVWLFVQMAQETMMKISLLKYAKKKTKNGVVHGFVNYSESIDT